MYCLHAPQSGRVAAGCRSRRSPVANASDTPGATGPGLANKPAMQPPTPQLQPLAPRPGMASTPGMVRPGPMTNGGGAPGPAAPGMQRPMAPPPPPGPAAARPGPAMQPTPSLRPLQPPQQPLQQQPPAAPPQQQPRTMPQQQPPVQVAARPAAIPGTPPGMQAPQRPLQAPPGLQQPPRPLQQQQPVVQRPPMQPQQPLQQRPLPGGSAGLPQQQQPLTRPPPLAPPPAAAGTAAGAGAAPRPVLQRPPMAPPGAAAGAGLAPKPLPPRPPLPPAPGAAAGGVQARPPAMPVPGQVGLNRPAFSAAQAQQATAPLVRPVMPGASNIEMRRPDQAAAAAAGGSRTEIGLNRPILPAAPPAPAPGSAAAEGARRVTGRLGRFEVVEEDEEVPDEDEEDEEKKKAKKKRGKKEKVTAEMKRAARKQREVEREEKAAKGRREREEIFEVGDEGMSLEALAEVIQIDASDIVRSLFMKGIMLSLNQVLDKNTVKLVASEYDLLVVDKEEAGVTAGAVKQRDFMELEDFDDAKPRPPVVTVMGHVDHGKTSLLDFIRKAKVAAGEAGGITQAIGAYNVDVEVDGDKKTICFLDTPGHEAFSAMRARGARVTDIAIIIVAADDGVQPQTREAVSHAQAAEVPIVVAINKIDKPGADVERAKQSLLELNLVPEEWGGTTPMVAISAKKGTGIDDLLQTVLWVAEEKALMANPDRLAAGTVIEAHLDKKRGPVATLLVQAGTLKVGDVVACGACHGKVRTLSNAAGAAIQSAGPSIAVQLIGLNAVPQAGDEFQVHASDSDARAAADTASQGLRAARIAEMSSSGSMVTLSSLATMDEDVDTLQRMNLIIKGDTSGVVEAIKGALQHLPQESVVLRYLLCAAGDITTSDIDLAAASGGMVVGFNLEPDEGVLSHAKRLGVTINTYRVIYNLIDDVKAAMEGKLRQVEEKQPLGTATVKAVFGSGKKKVAGCLVDEGRLQKGAMMEVTRGKQVVFTGKIASLRRIKDNVDEVQNGLECGVGAEDWTSWNEGDVINCYLTVSKSQRLEDARAATAVDVASLS